MKIIQLEILNLASLDRQGGETINFEEGALGDTAIFIIVGPTGSGKSTLLDAICLPLYNLAPRYPKKKGDRKQHIEIYGESEESKKNRLAPTDQCNILTRGKKDGYSKLTFLADNGNLYRAEWHVHRKRTNVESSQVLYLLRCVDGIMTEEVAEWETLPSIIGLEYDQFLRTVLIAQGSFANFLTAKEDERYALLEKLIGCEELYANITTKIKARKEEAIAAYNEVAANLSAQEKDLIPETELDALTERIRVLDEEERKTKAELGRLTEAIAWYAKTEEHNNCIKNHQQALEEAEAQLTAIKAQVERLRLHDATEQAVDHYKDMVQATSAIKEHNDTLACITQTMADKTSSLKDEEDNLKREKGEAQKAIQELEQQKPHINKARQIKGELKANQNTLSEKKLACKNAGNAKTSAAKAVDDNAEAITKAQKTLTAATSKRTQIIADTDKRKAALADKTRKARTDYEAEYSRYKDTDADTLQEAKAEPEKPQTDLKESIRVLDSLTTKRNLVDKQTMQMADLANRNDEIIKALDSLNIDSLTQEVDTLTQTYTLMTSENWAMHRQHLSQGSPCPLCGATDHPYHDEEQVAPVINQFKDILDEKKGLLSKRNKEQSKLTQEQHMNTGKQKALEETLKTLKQELDTLAEEWQEIRARRTSWPEQADMLREMTTETDRRANDTAEALKQYNEWQKRTEALRKTKEQAEKEERNYTEEATSLMQQADGKVAEAQTALAAVNGQTETLKAQLSEKTSALDLAQQALGKAQQEYDTKAQALKEELDGKDPDSYEQMLQEAVSKAQQAIEERTKHISTLQADLKGLKGRADEVGRQKEAETAKQTKAQKDLDEWLADYNNKVEAAVALSIDDIAQLHAATDNWEGIRQQQTTLSNALTAARTTLTNEQKALDEHLTKRPEESLEWLKQRKAEIDAMNHDELINAKSRLQRHEAAKRQMGEMFEQRQSAELLKREWEQIDSAIGGDGKTLRKIAQCYTLRFLVEHANDEIRKFNSRYELLHVKNSLGIRVIDHDRADDVRDTTSLSGGETFIVSLGLALGLSALSSRNISFGNLFIDEGFGTLDPDTLATVIDSLAMLQTSQGKKVGVISHTDTMSERITTQIRIIKNGNTGSSHIEIYP